MVYLSQNTANLGGQKAITICSGTTHRDSILLINTKPLYHSVLILSSDIAHPCLNPTAVDKYRYKCLLFIYSHETGKYKHVMFCVLPFTEQTNTKGPPHISWPNQLICYYISA